MDGWMVVSITIIIEGWESLCPFIPDSSVKGELGHLVIKVDYSLQKRAGWAASIHSQCAREQNSATY